MLIATEGVNKTERNYFLEFNRKQDFYRIVLASGSSTDPIGIVKEAILSYEKFGLETVSGDIAYAVFDTDFGKEMQIEEARSLAKKNGIKLALSNPCFEVWLMLHFRFSTKGYYSNEEVNAEISKIWPDYRKNISSFESIHSQGKTAINRANRLKRFHTETGAKGEIEYCNPSTDVHRIVELLIDNNKTI